MFHNVSPQAREIPGIKIFRSSATIYYTNAEMYLEALQEKVCVVTKCTAKNDLDCFSKLSLVSHFFPLFNDAGLFVQSGIDVGKLLTEKKKRDSKLKRKQKKEKRQAQKEAKRAKKEAEKEVRHIKKHPVSRFRFKLIISFLQTADSQTSVRINEGKLFTGSDQQSGTALHMTVKPGYRLSNGRENWAYQHDTADSDSDMGSHGDDAIPAHPPHADEEKGMTCGSGTHSIILDISTTNFVDMVTVKTLKNVSGPVSLNHRLVQNNVNKTQQLLGMIFINNSEKNASVMFYCLRYSETLARLIWTSI